MNQFANVLTRIAGQSLKELFSERIAGPIGMHSGAWNWGDWGQVDGLLVCGGAGNKSKGIHISARELARFGLLFLNEGNWNGEQLISREWVTQATSVQVEREGYGYNWWCNWPGAPEGTYAAAGFNNNKCFVIPGWDMVIVRLGTDGNVPNRRWNKFFERLAPGVKVSE